MDYSKPFMVLVRQDISSADNELRFKYQGLEVLYFVIGVFDSIESRQKFIETLPTGVYFTLYWGEMRPFQVVNKTVVEFL